MKQYLLLAGAIIGIAQVGSAAPMCTTGSLASYIGLGSTGCMVGNSTVYSFSVIPGIAGATPIAPANVTVNPLATVGLPGLSFVTNTTVQANQIAESIFNYSITGEGYSMLTASVSGTSVTGDGVATLIKDVCLNGTFNATGTSGCIPSGGTRAANIVIVNNGTDTVNFPVLARSINLTDDFTLDGGLAGSATGGTFTNQFAVPEPATVLLTGLGLAFVAFRKRRSALSLLSKNRMETLNE